MHHLTEALLIANIIALLVLAVVKDNPIYYCSGVITLAIYIVGYGIIEAINKKRNKEV